MSNLSQEIRDLIQKFPILDLGPTATATALLDILRKINQRIDELEARNAHADRFGQLQKPHLT